MFFVFKKEDLRDANEDLFVNLKLIEYFKCLDNLFEESSEEPHYSVMLSFQRENTLVTFASKEKRDEYLEKLKTFVVNDDDTMSQLEHHIKELFGSAKKKVDEVKSNVVSMVGRNKKPAAKKTAKNKAVNKKATKKASLTKPTKRKK